jgi:hypothetical protein
VEVVCVKAQAHGLAKAGGQDNGNRRQWVVNAQPEAGRTKVVVITQDGRLWTRRLTPEAPGPGCPSGRLYWEREGTRLMNAHELIARYEAGARDFSWANLSQADLSGAVLSNAVLYHANLSGANLKGAKLDSADLIGANLREANLREAILTGANLREAHLGMADLARANLSGARVTSEQLDKAASLKGAAMPDGTKHE